MQPQPGPSILFDFFATSQRLKVLLADAMAGSGLRADEYAVYSVLVDDGPSSPTRMAEAVGMPPTTMSHYLRTMLERGHVERTRHPRDHRSVVVTLTATGRAAHRGAAAAFEEANRRFLAGLTVSDASARRVLRALSVAADAAVVDLRTATSRTA